MEGKHWQQGLSPLLKVQDGGKDRWDEARGTLEAGATGLRASALKLGLLPPMSCVALGKVIHLFVPPFPHL